MKHLILSFFIFCILACSLEQEPKLTQKWNIHFLDIGQGLSVLLESNGKFALYDTGPDSMGLQNILEKFHIHSLEWVVISHFHRDHAGGFLEIAKKNAPFEIKEVFLSPDTTENWTTDSIHILLQERNIPSTILYKGDSILFDETPLKVLWPSSERNWGENNASIVLNTKIKDESLLLTGDIESEIESKILENFPSLRGSLFQVPHHGGATSSSLRFLENLQIQYAVISCHKNNPYGHPAQETLKKIEATTGEKNNIYRTDSLGNLCFTWEHNVGIWPCQKNH